MPSFREWTLARAAALPEMLVMPIGEVPQGEPQCRGFREVIAREVGTNPAFVLTNAPALLGELTAMAASEHSMTGETPRPGPDRLWLHDPLSPMRSCRYHGRSPVGPLQSLVPTGAGRVAALVGTRAMPMLGPEGHNLPALAITLRRDTLRLEPVDGAPDGLRGVVIAAGPVEQVTGWRGIIGRDIQEALSLTPPDWAAPEPAKLAANDVVGLTIGMTLSEFQASATEHLGQAVLFTEKVPGKGMFGHARGLLNLETGEALAAIYAPRAEGQPVVAIMRRMLLPEGQHSLESLKLSLTQKYGEVSREVQEGYWLWGTLPESEDGWGVCGGPSLIMGGASARDAAPQLIPTEDIGEPPGSYANRPDYWFEIGWPEVVTDRPGQPDPARCGPVVGAVVTTGPQDRQVLQIWLIDRKLAGELDDIPAPPVEAAPIKL